MRPWYAAQVYVDQVAPLAAKTVGSCLRNGFRTPAENQKRVCKLVPLLHVSNSDAVDG